MTNHTLVAGLWDRTAPISGSFENAGLEYNFDAITSLVRAVLKVRSCAVTLNDNSVQWLEWSDGLQSGKEDDELGLSVPSTACFLYNIRYAAVPLLAPDGRKLGMLCITDLKPLSLNAETRDILGISALLIVEKLVLVEEARHDFLTGALTRRAFSDGCASAIRHYSRDGTPSALVMFDLDNFKLINDIYGHATGDKVLEAVAHVCAQSLRPGDIFGRLGGEEFGVILAKTDFASAILFVERIRLLIEKQTLDCGRVTASFGLSMVEDHHILESWFASADRALYQAKRGGRNCLVVE